MPVIPRQSRDYANCNPPWKRSRKNNLYKRFPDGSAITVFVHKDGLTFGYCVHTLENGVRFSPYCWHSEEEALTAAEEEINRCLTI